MKLQRVLREVHDLWLMVGITLFLFLLIEGALSFAFLIKDRLADSDSTVDSRTKADTYDQAPWVDPYFEEFRTASEAVWEPYVYWRRLPFEGDYIHVDPQGIRSTASADSDSLAPSAAFQISMFGGSTLWGTGARDEFTIPSALSAELTKQGLRTEITNYGESGYVSTQEVILLMTLLQKGTVPDLVIFYDGVNDTYSAHQDQIAGIPQNESNRVNDFNLSKSESLRRRLVMDARDVSVMLSTSRFLTGLLKRVGVQWEGKIGSPRPVVLRRSKASSPDSLAEEVVKAYRRNIELVMALGDHYHFHCLFYWQPMILQKDHLTDYEAEKRQEVAPFEQLFLKTYQELASTPLSETESLHFRDLSKVFSSTREPLYLDWCHVGETGNGVIARRMANDVLVLKKGWAAKKGA